MAVLIIFPVILQTVINLTMLSIGGQGWLLGIHWYNFVTNAPLH